MKTTAPWLDIPEGHYAIVDPHNPDTVTYWRRKDVKSKYGPRPRFDPWPLKAKHGPRLLRSDIPTHLHGQARDEWIRAWFAEHARPYRAAVIDAIKADPVAAGKRFADLEIRCCICGRALTEDHSKVYGIGPECRAGMTAETLARYYTPKVGEAHAEQLTVEETRT